MYISHGRAISLEEEGKRAPPYSVSAPSHVNSYAQRQMDGAARTHLLSQP